jgi:Right handed beta helix region
VTKQTAAVGVDEEKVMAVILGSIERRSGAWRGLLAMLVALSAAALPVRAADVHMAPDGDDARNGTSPANAVQTLRRAFDLAFADTRGKGEPMRIVVAQGSYHGPPTLLDGKRLGRDITVVGAASDPKDFPTFIGDGEKSTWLRVTASEGKRTGLTIQALEIRDYFVAISIEGNRDRPEAFNAGTTIRRNVFRNIGSIAIPGDGLSTAVVRFVNSRDNVVENNFFQRIRNKDLRECGALHALYIAHFSSNNRFVNNTVVDTCGSVVKLRDRSNGNVIEDNTFERIQNAPVIEEWFCDKLARKDCTKSLGECPSTGNTVARNTRTGNDGEYVAITGGRKPREWCRSEDFSAERVRTK